MSLCAIGSRQRLIAFADSLADTRVVVTHSMNSSATLLAVIVHSCIAGFRSVLKRPNSLSLGRKSCTAWLKADVSDCLLISSTF